MTIASKSSPHRHGFCVTSNVQRSMMRLATPYCAAARMIPGGLAAGIYEELWVSVVRVGNADSPFPLICRPSMSDPKTNAPKYAVVWQTS